MTQAEHHQEQTERYRRVCDIIFRYEAVMMAAIKHFDIKPESSIHVSKDDMIFLRGELGIPVTASIAPEPARDYAPAESRL